MAKKTETKAKVSKDYDYANYNESNPAPRDPNVRYSDEDLEEFKAVIVVSNATVIFFSFATSQPSISSL